MSSSQNVSIGKSDPGSAKLVATLSFAGLLSGLIIVLAYESTLPTITVQSKVMKEAVFKVLPGVSRMQRLVYRNGALNASEQVRKDDEEIFSGYDASGQLVRYAIRCRSWVPGHHSSAVRIYSGEAGDHRHGDSGEPRNPRLGDKIYKDPAFVANFDSLR